MLKLIISRHIVEICRKGKTFFLLVKLFVRILYKFD
jgi:hypothetical protein